VADAASLIRERIRSASRFDAESRSARTVFLRSVATALPTGVSAGTLPAGARAFSRARVSLVRGARPAPAFARSRREGAGRVEAFEPASLV
jgi:hypothetical protein